MSNAEEILPEVAYEITNEHPAASFAPKLVGRWVFLNDGSYSYDRDSMLRIIEFCEFLGIPPTARFSTEMMMGMVRRWQELETRLDELEGELRARPE